MCRFFMQACLSVAYAVCLVSFSQAINRDWDGGGGDNTWSNPANWSPNGDPGDDDLTISGILVGAGPHTVLDTDFVVSSLLLSNSSEVDANNFLLAVEGHTQLDDSGTRLQLYERTSGGDEDSLDTDTLTIGGGSTVEMYENSVLEVDNGLLSVLGTLVGNGELELNDNPATPTGLLSILGLVSAGEPGTFIGTPPARTLNITATDADARIAMTNVGLIEVQENATLNNQVRMQNDVVTNLRLSPNSTYHVDHSWDLSGTLSISTGPFSGTDPATLSGSQANLLLELNTGSTVTIDEEESLRFAIEVFAHNGSAVSNGGTVIFDAPAHFDSVANLRMPSAESSLVVNDTVTVTQSTFNMDGLDTSRNEITVNAGGTLTLDVDQIDTTDNVADGTIRINSGVLEVGVEGSGWIMDGTMFLNNSDAQPAIVRKSSSQVVEGFQIGDSSGSGDARLIVQGTGESVIEYDFVYFQGDADVDISEDAIVNLNGQTFFLDSTATFDGAGILRPGQMRVVADTTFNVAIVDLDDEVSPGGQFHVLEAPLTINANAIDTFNPAVAGFDGDIEINNNGPIVNTDLGRLTVNLPSGIWRFDSGTITANNNSPTETATVLDGSDVLVGANAAIVSNGHTESLARLDILGSIDVPASNDSFTLSGGSTAEPNRLAGGVISGDGELIVSNSALSGDGTINTDLDGTFSSRLVADGGTLEVNGSLDAFLEIEVTDDGILNVASNWDTLSAGDVVLTGGEVTGATIHNNFGLNPIRGYGLVTAQIENDGRIRAENGTLVLEPNASNDWDGSGSGGLIAESGDMILRNAGVGSSMFEGRIIIGLGHEIFVDGFNLRHVADASLELNGGTYRTTGTTELNASIATDGSGPSTIQNDMSVLLEFGDNSTTTLNQDLHVDAFSAVIRGGATTSGVGALVNDRHLTLSDGLGLPVGLVNNSLLDVGSVDVDSSLGTVDLDSLTQSAAGDLTIDILGLGSGQFDLLMVNNNAILDGTLSVNLLGSFTPVLGNSWTILTTSLGLVDADTLALDAPTVNDLTFDLIVNSDNIMLQVVEAGLTGDFDDDGDVDGFDFLAWQRGESPNPLSPSDLADWELNYGTTADPLAAASTVPEPSLVASAIVFWLASTARRCRVTPNRVLR